MATTANPGSWLTKKEKFVSILGLITTGICLPIHANKVWDFSLFIILYFLRDTRKQHHHHHQQSGMNLIKAGAQHPESFTPSEIKKVLVGERHTAQSTYVTFCLLYTIASQISIWGWKWKGLMFSSVFLLKLISFPAFEDLTTESSWQVWLFCQRTQDLSCLRREYAVSLICNRFLSPEMPGQSLACAGCWLFAMKIGPKQCQNPW